jgi:signal transduction histidine kinase
VTQDLAALLVREQERTIELEKLTATLVARTRLAELVAHVGLTLTAVTDLRDTLQACAEAIVTQADAAFAGIWTFEERGQLLELQASAGTSTHTGVANRVPVGQSTIGRIAQEQRRYVSNRVVGDDRVAEQDWARREGIVALAGYPLMVGDELVGVIATFARRELSDMDRLALGAVSHGIALGIQRRRSEEALRRRAEELSRLAAALERSNQELDAFAYAASHDLRAPLRGIANLAQWIEEDLEDTIKDETREMLQLMRGRMHRMEALIEGILQYSRAGRMHSAPEMVRLERLLHEIVELLAPPDAASIEIPADLPAFTTERLPLQQIFMNLIGNAIKYGGGDAAVVTIGWREAGRFYEFSVSDRGPGIPEEFQDRIWGIFQTLEPRDRVEAAGVGLALVKKLVEAQGGRVWVESKVGEGSTFRFLWPRYSQETA